MGPAKEDAERAGGADVSLPGRKSFQTTFQEGTAVRRPRLVPGRLRSVASRAPNLFARVARGRDASPGLVVKLGL